MPTPICDSAEVRFLSALTTFLLKQMVIEMERMPPVPTKKAK